MWQDKIYDYHPQMDNFLKRKIYIRQTNYFQIILQKVLEKEKLKNNLTINELLNRIKRLEIVLLISKITSKFGLLLFYICLGVLCIGKTQRTFLIVFFITSLVITLVPFKIVSICNNKISIYNNNLCNYINWNSIDLKAIRLLAKRNIEEIKEKNTRFKIIIKYTISFLLGTLFSTKFKKISSHILSIYNNGEITTIYCLSLNVIILLLLLNIYDIVSNNEGEMFKWRMLYNDLQIVIMKQE